MEFKIKRNSKYRNLILIYIIYIIFWLILTAILNNIFTEKAPIDLTRFIPINDLLTELALIFIFILPLSALLGLFIGGYLITPIILVLHKKIIGSKMFYGIQKKSGIASQKIFNRGFFPVLMAINLSSLFLTPVIMGYILHADVIAQFENTLRNQTLTRLLAESVLLIITFGLATFFFSPVWFLRDSGIIYSNKEKVEHSQEQFIFKSIGDWYQTILKSYAGIGAFITYILLIYDFIRYYIDNIGSPGLLLNIPSLILWLGLPFYLIISLIPALICNDLIRNHRNRYIRKIGEKMGITHNAIISFELKEDRNNFS